MLAKRSRPQTSKRGKRSRGAGRLFRTATYSEPVKPARKGSKEPPPPPPPPPKPAAPWAYEGKLGPTHWGKLDTDYSLCGSGKRQSPIDIRNSIRADLTIIVDGVVPTAVAATGGRRSSNRRNRPTAAATASSSTSNRSCARSDHGSPRSTASI